MSRQLRTNLPTAKENLIHTVQDPKILRGKEEAYRLKSAQNYNKRHKLGS